MTGRPSSYTQAVADEICERLAKGESLRSICRDDHMPNRSTVSDWYIKNTQGFASQYTRSRDIGLDNLADEVFDIADDARNDWIEKESKRTGQKYVALNEEALGRSRLRFDARRWYLSKLAPKRYGDRLQQEITNPDGSLTGNASDATIAAKLAAIQQAALARKNAQEDGGDDGDCTDLV